MPRFQKTITASQTDSALVSARSGQKIRVTGLHVVPGSATTVTLNSKPAGAGSAISPALGAATVLPQNTDGWFETSSGEGLTATTSAGADSYVVLTYQFVYS